MGNRVVDWGWKREIDANEEVYLPLISYKYMYGPKKNYTHSKFYRVLSQNKK